MATRLSAVVEGEYPAGVYRWPSRAHPGALGRELAGSGWSGYELCGVTDADRFFEECAGILAFPGWFALDGRPIRVLSAVSASAASRLRRAR